MDKNLQRIVGVLIVLALAVVLSPLLFSKNNESSLPTITTVAQLSATEQSKATPAITQSIAESSGNVKTSTADALPLAAHSTAVATSPAEPAQVSPVTQSPVVAESPAVATLPPQPKTVQSTTASDSDDAVAISSVIGSDSDDEVLPEEDDTFTSLPSPQESFESAKMVTPDHIASQDNLDRVKTQPKKPQAKISAASSTVSKATKAVKPVVTANKKNLEKVTKTAWMIQLGSFKNKMNAIHLTNKLRAVGYTAFTREINSKSGSLRIVYIGPEAEFTSARMISKKLEQDLKLQGIVVSYKPLAL